MEHNEMVQKLHEKANIPASEARDALERADWDMLEALIILEKEGKIAPLTASVTTVENQSAYEEVTATASARKNRGNKNSKFADQTGNFFDKLAELIKKSITHSFVVERKNRELLSLPVFLLIIIGASMFQVTIIAVIIGLFCDCKYSIEDKSDKKTGDKNERSGKDGQS